MMPMNPSNIYGIGFVGCGRAAAELHIPALGQLKQARVVALADPDAGARAAVAAKFGIDRCVPDLESLLGLPGIDVVAVCVPAAEHVSAALTVLEAGRHLLVEKPLAPDRGGCRRLIDASAGYRGRIAVGFNLRFHRLVEAARAAIASGRLGRVEAVESTWTSAIRQRRELPSWRNDRRTGGGALFEIAVHHFDLWRYLLGTHITEIHAYSRCEEWPDESSAVTARLANGAVANGFFSERCSDRNAIVIHGRKGRLSLDLFRYDGLTFTAIEAEPGLRARIREAAAAAASLPRGIALMRKGGDFRLSYLHQWRAFLASIESNRFVGASLEDGYAAVNAVLGAIESSDTGLPVVLR